MMNVEGIISAFEGISKLARALDLPVTTVRGWKESGVIPDKYHQNILDVAAKRSLSLTPEDFMAFPLDHPAFQQEPTA